ncbi:unnamed protein product [Linum tenue]|uniref:BHLH domain-containing protein n=1 Tax=Linum tenue TaxID=586396 RepID=A0AAV0HUA2_9ROSI|nr:unnamed protein product [Linum tenue]
MLPKHLCVCVELPKSLSSTFSEPGIPWRLITEFHSVTCREMMKSGNGKSHAEEEDDGDDYDSPSSRGEMTKDDGKSSDQKGKTHRSKHSETEQRRRSKINERFQVLRELIPQNDQKRDKASFLLEVIGYIQFLQERLHRYEGSYNGSSQVPAKLTPWQKTHLPSETLVDHSQILKIGSAHESTVALANARSSMEFDLEASTICKALNHAPGTPPVQYNMLPDSSMLGAIRGLNDMSTPCLQDSTSDTENMAHQIQSELWHGQPFVTECTAPSSVLNGQQLTREGGTASVSDVYSQGVLSSLAQALQSSGVDLSQTSISVQINVDKSANHGPTALGLSPPKVDEEAQYLNNQVMEEQSPADESDQHSCKRLRTENC